MPDDPSATYRGFRSQALYVLHRLLTDPDRADLIFRPEGDEDLAIYNRRGDLIEAVQVKDYSSPLNLSDLKYKTVESFFGRLRSRIKQVPACKTRIATYGPLGPELEGAITGEEESRRDIVRKIKKFSDWKNEGEIADALQRLDGNVERLDRNELTQEIEERLAGTVIGGDVATAMDLLMYWVFDASERSRDVNEKHLVGKIEEIGNFLVQSHDFSAEWGTSIYTVRGENLSCERKAELVAEYRTGRDARFEHILASADAPRSELLAEVQECFTKHQVVVIRGASGQGKSSLGWRYLHDHCADGLRFQIRHLESRQQAMRIANALGTHIRKLKLPATVFLDILPSTIGWAELVMEFSKFGIRALVCVREEDFLRSSVSDYQFDYGVVPLQRILKTEAEEIYKALEVPGESVTLNFEDAWTRFEEGGGGPLMEFTHLITAGESLSSRISQQIARLRSEPEAGPSGLSSEHLEFLSLAAVANAAGAQVSYERLCREVGLERITDPVRLVEYEYLFRLAEEGEESVIIGLHAIRSQAIVDAVYGDDSKLLTEFVVRVLPLVLDSDIRSYLLYAFAERKISSDRILTALKTFAARSWSHACGIAEALLWYGIDSYERSNQDKIHALIGKFKRAWFITCDICVGTKETSTALAEMLPNYDPGEAELTPKDEVFHALRGWLVGADVPEGQPKQCDWGRLGDLMFWSGFANAEGTIPEALRAMEIDLGDQTISAEDLGRWIIGRSEMSDDDFEAWHASIGEELKSKFLTETRSIDLADDGSELAAVYALAPASDGHDHGATPIGSNLNSATMARLNLLRLFFPRRETYCGKAFGVRELGFMAGFDESEKRIPISNLRAPLGVRLNANFRNLVSYRHERPDSWSEYVENVMAYRKSVVSYSEKIAQYWNRMLSTQPSRRGNIKGYPLTEKELVSRLDFPQKLPKVTVDPFGFLEEGGLEKTQEGNADPVDGRSEFLGKFSRWQKSLGDYSSHMTAFSRHAEEISSRLLRGANGMSGEDGHVQFDHLALWCAGEAWSALEEVQTEFRLHFWKQVGENRLKQLERKERAALEKLWSAAVAMRYHRTATAKNLPRRVFLRLDAKKGRLPGALASALDGNGNRQVSIPPEPVMLGDDRCLVIVCHYPDMSALEADRESLVVSSAVAFREQAWRMGEWQIVASHWPMVAFVKTVGGNAWAPLAAKIATPVLMMGGDGFEVKAHHMALLEVPQGHFFQTGVNLVAHPVVRALGEVHKSLISFAAAVEIHCEILEHVSERRLPDTEIERIAKDYLKEVRKACDRFLNSCEHARSIISQSEEAGGDEWGESLEGVRNNCAQIMQTGLFSPTPVLDPIESAESSSKFREGIENFHQLFESVIDALFCRASECNH